MNVDRETDAGIDGWKTKSLKCAVPEAGATKPHKRNTVLTASTLFSQAMLVSARVSLLLVRVSERSLEENI